MQGKVCMVTGASSGIGKMTALGLARLGASVIAVCRDQDRGAAAVAEIKAQTGNENVSLMLCDLSSQRSIRACAAEFKANHAALHVLVNNAGLIIGQRTVTEDGLELTFALNHLGYFLLTTLLLDVLKASAPARVVSVASEGRNLGRIDFDDLMSERSYSSLRAYGTSKLANILFTYELARRLEGTGVTATCAHPGGVATNFANTAGGLFKLAVKLAKPFLLSAERGAETPLWLASSPEAFGVSGKYFAKKKQIFAAYDPALCVRLWEESEKLVAATA